MAQEIPTTSTETHKTTSRKKLYTFQIQKVRDKNIKVTAIDQIENIFKIMKENPKSVRTSSLVTFSSDISTILRLKIENSKKFQKISDILWKEYKNMAHGNQIDI